MPDVVQVSVLCPLSDSRCRASENAFGNNEWDLSIIFIGHVISMFVLSIKQASSSKKKSTMNQKPFKEQY